MKKSTLYALSFVFLLLSVRTHAQAVDTSTMDKLIRYVLQPLDKSQVTTHYLEEYGAGVVPMATFNGVLTDSNRIDMNLWRTLYFQLYTGYVGTGLAPIDSIPAVNTKIRQSAPMDSFPIPVPIIIGQYNSVKSNAFSSNLLSYNSAQNQVHDVAGRPQSPYQQNVLFAASPNRATTIRGTENFIYKPSLVWNNTGKTITSVMIDFGNGGGFRTMTANTAVSVSYTDTGTVRWTIKVTLSDNSVLQCYSQYQVLKASAGALARFSASSYNDYWYVPTTAAYSGANVYISYTNKSRTNTMRKPLIVVEGWDISSIAPDLQSNYSYSDFVNAISAPTTYDFNGQLDDVAGYDLVFIDFFNGTDDITRNAKLIEHVIDLVNTAKTNAGSTQQNVVMGLSMGGLVARYALADMTKSSHDPKTRLLITHDSPHEGANVPMGLQNLIQMAGSASLFGYSVRNIYPNYDEALNLLNAPATQQMLLYRTTGANTFVSNTFLSTTYRSMITYGSTGPQPAYKFIATSLGSECAHALFPSYQELLNVNVDGYLFFIPLLSYRLHVIIQANALPDVGSTNRIARFSLSSKFKLFGLITISKTVFDQSAYAPGNQLPVDGAPGSTTPYFSAGKLPQISIGFPIPYILGIAGYVNAQVSGDPTFFSFVPVASALDASPFSTGAFSSPFVGGINASYPSTSATFIAQEASGTGSSTIYNNTHILFTARNSQWLYDQMENIANTINCSSQCSSVVNYSISGPASFCTSAVYNIAGVPPGITVTWSATPAGLVNLAPNGTSVTLTRTGFGTVSLKAVFSAATCGAIPAVTSSIAAGGCVTVKNNGTAVMRGTINFTDNLGTTTPAALAAPQNTVLLSLIPGQYTLSASLSPGQPAILVDEGLAFQVVPASGNFATVAVGDGYIVNAYSPYYLNVLKSQAFIRNNCPTGQYGSSVTYTVPAAKYFSGVSQADADSKATNDISSNGQAYANAHGTCAAASVNMQNSSDGKIAVQFLQGTTTVYSGVLLLGANQTVTTIPPGIYTVAMQNAGPGSTHRFTVNGSSQTGTNVTFPGITVGSSIVNISITNSTGFAVFPNPAGSLVQITLKPETADLVETQKRAAVETETTAASKTTTVQENDLGIQSVELYDITGRMRKQETFDPGKKKRTVQIDISGLTPGTYIVEVSDGRNKSWQKLIIMR